LYVIIFCFLNLYFSFPSQRFTIPPAGFVDARQPLQRGPYLFGRQENSVFQELNLGSVAPHFPLSFPGFQPEVLPRQDLAVEPARSGESSKKSSSSEQPRLRWTEGEVKLLIAIYREEYPKRDKGKSLEAMWDRIAARLVADSKEINDFVCKKSAKNCRDKINNLSKKYKTVKDKSKLTGEGSGDITSFPEFNDLDEIWGTRDSVNPRYVIEAGTSRSPATHTPSPSSSVASQSAVNTSASSIDETELDENLPLETARDKSAGQRKKGKEPVGNQGKRTRPADDDDDDASTDDEALKRAERVFFKDKKKPVSKKKKSKPGKKDDEQRKEEEMLKELIKAQTEAAKRAEEEKKELFQYLRESDNRTQELVLGAIRELGAILKK